MPRRIENVISYIQLVYHMKLYLPRHSLKADQQHIVIWIHSTAIWYCFVDCILRQEPCVSLLKEKVEFQVFSDTPLRSHVILHDAYGKT